MQIIYILLVCIALAMDCFAISIAMSSISGVKRHDYIKIPLHFAFFHLAMVLIGYYIGSFFKEIIQGVDHWVAFILLAGIGIKIITDSMQNSRKIKKPASEGRLLLLSFATSVDALVIGITFAFTFVDLHYSSFLLTLTVAIISFLGLFIGSKLHKLNLRYVGVFGGVILIIIGVKTLVTHTFA